METPPFISVVIAARNAEATIGACLDAIVAQDYPSERREILVVDNASTDRTAEIVGRYPARCLREPRVGRAFARNRGIESSRGDVVAFVDADCVAKSGWLRELARGFDTGCAAVAGEVLPQPPRTSVQRYMAAREPRLQDPALANVHPFFVTANIAFTKEALDRVGSFDPRFVTGEDSDFAWRFFSDGLVLRYAPGAVVFHEHRENWSDLFRQQLWLGYGRILLRYRYGEPLVRYELRYYRQLGAAALRTARAIARYALTPSGRTREAAEEAAYETTVRLALRLGSLLWAVEQAGLGRRRRP